MPLRDHFRPPLDDFHSWDELRGGWPTMIVRELVKILPEPLPTLPIWLTPTLAIALDVESSYEVTCRTLRIR